MALSFPGRIARGLVTLVKPGPRLVDEIECALSVLLAIAFGHLVGGHNVFWAAFAGYLVMCGHVAETLPRGARRVIGSGVGAGLAMLVAPAARLSLPLAALLCALVGGFALYRVLTSRHGYAWVLVGLAFELTLVSALAHHDQDVQTFAITWVLQTAAGTVACVLVSCISTLTARRRWPGTPLPARPHVAWDSRAARHAAQAATALALVPPLAIFGVPGIPQSAMTILLVMIVPLSSLGTTGLGHVNRRILHRAAGCFAGCVLAALFLFAAQGSAPVLIAGMVIGLMLGRHIENGEWGIPYLGVQLTLAVLTALVPDSYAHATLDPALGRLTGILIGIAIIWAVLLAWALASRALGRHWQAAQATQGPKKESPGEQMSTD